MRYDYDVRQTNVFGGYVEACCVCVPALTELTRISVSIRQFEYWRTKLQTLNCYISFNAGKLFDLISAKHG